MIRRTYKRWALGVDANGLTPAFILGRFCYTDRPNIREACKAELVPTFRTREEAREAKRNKLSSYRREAKPVRVTVTIEEGWGSDG